VAAAIPAVLGAVQMGMAARQKKQRPIYDIPQASKEAMENQRRLAAMEKAPGTDALLNQIRQQGAAATQNVKEMTGGSAGGAKAATDIYGKELEALQGMQANQQQFRLQQQQNLNQALNQYGQMQQQAWDYNVNQPYQQAMAAKSALTGAGLANLTNAATGTLGTIGAAQQSEKMMDFYRDLYNLNKNQQVQVSLPTNPSNLNWSQMAATDISGYAQPNPFYDVILPQ
jgi:hypothetical protein